MDITCTRLSGAWTPFVGEIFNTRRDDKNCHDRHLVAVLIDSCEVGDLP